MGIDRADILECLNILRQKNIPFYSEADFQHQLAWEIHKKHPDSSVYLEVPYKNYRDGSKNKIYVDILINYKGRRIGLELKYKTAIFNYAHNEVEYNLASHGAQPLSRYDILKDIERLQNLINSNAIDDGYAIAVTNDKVLWSHRTNRNGSGSDFFLGDKKAGQILTWKDGFKLGSIGSHRAENISFLYPVKIQWEPWCAFTEGNNKEFKYIMVNCGNYD